MAGVGFTILASSCPWQSAAVDKWRGSWHGEGSMSVLGSPRKGRSWRGSWFRRFGQQEATGIGRAWRNTLGRRYSLRRGIWVSMACHLRAVMYSSTLQQSRRSQEVSVMCQEAAGETKNRTWKRKSLVIQARELGLYLYTMRGHQ